MVLNAQNTLKYSSWHSWEKWIHAVSSYEAAVTHLHL